MSSTHAPPVSYPVGRSLWVLGMLMGCWVLAAAVTAGWWHLAAPGHAGPWLGVAALVLSGGGALWGWQRSPTGVLQWDGQDWQWQSAGYQSPTTVDAPEPVLDLQNLLLVRMHNRAGAPWWVWADAASDPLHWLDLRRALYARPAHAGVAP